MILKYRLELSPRIEIDRSKGILKYYTAECKRLKKLGYSMPRISRELDIAHTQVRSLLS